MKNRVCVLDTETTSLDWDEGRIVELCIRNLYDPTEMLTFRFNPGVLIPKEASDVHGILDEHVADCPKFDVCADRVKEVIESYDLAIVGYNVKYDVIMLERHFERAGLSVAWPTYQVCALRVWSILEPRNLQEAYKHFVNPNGFQGAHGAAADVDATADVFLRQMTTLLSREKLAEPPWATIDDKREEREKYRAERALKLQEMSSWVGPSHHMIWNADRSAVLVNFGKMKGKPIQALNDWYCNFILEKDFPEHVKGLIRLRQQLAKSEDPQEIKRLHFINYANSL